MKRIFLILVLCAICFNGYSFNQELIVPEYVDDELAANATAVLRVECKEGPGECEKYCWQNVRISEILKNESKYIFPESIDVAYYNSEEGIPLGESTIYVERYNPDRDDLWKLTGGRTATGVSHSKK